jgi:uncharacterized membrane protein
MVLSAFILMIISAANAACFSVFLKKSTEKLLFSFWVSIFTFTGMMIAFWAHHTANGLSVEAVIQRMSNLAHYNSLNYALVTLIIVCAVALKAHLFHRFSLAKIIPILQIGTPLTAFLYWLLGNPLATHEVIGIGLIFFGAFISGFDRFYFPNILKPVESLPLSIYVGALTMALLNTTENLIVYLTTTQNETTSKVIDFLHAHGISYFTTVFTTPLEYFQMTTPFFITFFFLYVLLIAKKPLSIIGKEFKLQKNNILCASFANFVCQYLYYYVYAYNDQAVVVALTKFSVPLTLALAYLTLKEKLHAPELVGVSLIIIGGIVGAF